MTTWTIVVSLSMFGGEVALARGKLSLFLFVCDFFNFLGCCWAFFFVIVSACSLLHYFSLLQVCFSHFFLCFFFFCFCKFYVCIYFTTISRFQFAGSLHLVKDLTFHSSLVKRSRSCLKEGKLQKSQVCPLNLNNATSNLGSSKPRFFFKFMVSKDWRLFPLLGQFFCQIYIVLFFNSIFSNSFCRHYVKICPPKKCYLKLFVKWNEIQFQFFL